jgi:hypothetical protein
MDSIHEKEKVECSQMEEPRNNGLGGILLVP